MLFLYILFFYRLSSIDIAETLQLLIITTIFYISLVSIGPIYSKIQNVITFIERVFSNIQPDLPVVKLRNVKINSKCVHLKTHKGRKLFRFSQRGKLLLEKHRKILRFIPEIMCILSANPSNKE